MSTDNNKMQDTTSVELNPVAEDESIGENLDPVPNRPAKSANLSKWIDYAVTLGASREALEGDTWHHTGEYEEGSIEDSNGQKSVGLLAVYENMEMTKEDVIALCDRLGG